MRLIEIFGEMAEVKLDASVSAFSQIPGAEN
jgi:uncharacterized protein (DUF1810 family)